MGALLDIWREIRGRAAPPPAAPRDLAGQEADAPETVIDADDEFPPQWAAEPLTGRTILIGYRDTSRKVTERVVSCRRLAENAGVLYLHAWCHLRGAVRCFRVDRIVEVADPITGELFDPATFFAASRIDETSRMPFHFGLHPRLFGDFNAALNVLVFMARCDGSWHPMEARQIETFAASFWLRAEVAHPLDIAPIQQAVDRMAPDAEAFWTSLRRCAAQPMLSSIIRRHIAQVIDADGHHHAHEIYWGRMVDEFFTAPPD